MAGASAGLVKRGKRVAAQAMRRTAPRARRECRRLRTGGQAHGAGEPSAQAPEDFLTSVGWAAIQGHEDATAGLGEAWEAGRGVPREGPPGLVTLPEIGDHAWGNGP